MSDYLYYCANCNSLVADTYDDEELECDKCGAAMTPLHIDEDQWNAMSGEQKKSLIMRARNPQPRPQRRQISMDDLGDLDDDFEELQEDNSRYQQQRSQARPQGQYYGGQQRQKQVQPSRQAYQQQRQYANQQKTKDYYGQFSPLSIAAMVFSVIGCSGPLGIVLAIMDLTRNDGRKKGLSVAAIIVGVVMTVAAYSAMGANPGKEGNSADTQIVNETVEATVDKEEKTTPVANNTTDNNDDKETKTSSSDTSHEVIAKPSDGEIEEVGRLYLHEHADDYVGKWVRFAGKIVGINKENMQLDLEGPATLKTIYCNMMNDQDISSYNYDDYVTIVGKPDYKMIGQVMVNNCYVENTGDAAKDLDERLASEFPVEKSSSGGSGLFGTADIDTSNAIETTAKTVYKEMQDNQVACKTKYDGKTVKMKGIVDDIGTNIYGQEYVSFETGDPYSFEGVQVFFKNDQMDYVASLKKGDTITVYGIADIGSMTFKMGNCFPAEE